MRFSAFLPVLLGVLSLAPIAHADLSPFSNSSRPVPLGAKVSLEADQTDWFLGENIVLHFKVENVGDEPFPVSAGGDYRGGARATRFKITARDAGGQAVVDPNPINFHFGGFGGSQILQKGEVWFQTLSILSYCRFESSGEYEISAQHDLGWKATPERPRPVAKIKLRLQMPTPAEAQKVVTALETLPKNDGVLSGTKNSQPFPDFSALRYPVYLPILAPKIRAGEEKYLASIANMETPQATAFLVELLDQKPNLAPRAAQILAARLPFEDDASALASKTTQNQIAALKLLRQRVENSWRPEFAAPLRAYARRLLPADDRDSLRLAASLLQTLGESTDLSSIVAALDKRIAKTVQTPRWQHMGENHREDGDGWGLQDDCLELMRCGAMLVKHGASLPTSQTPGVIAIQIETMRHNPQRLKAIWGAQAAIWMRHPTPFLRQLALQSVTPPYLPQPTPPVRLIPAIRAILPALLLDSDVNVRQAASELAAKSGDKTLKAEILKNLTQSRNDWDTGSANRAAQSVGASFEAAQIWAARLDEPKMFGLALRSLAELTAQRGFSSFRTDTPAEVGARLKPLWQKFLRLNATRLQSGKLFTPAELPRELYPAEFRF